MHDLSHFPHYITAPMCQCMIIFICMFMVLKQTKTLINIKGVKQQQQHKTERQGPKGRPQQVKQKVKHINKTKEKTNTSELGFLDKSMRVKT